MSDAAKKSRSTRAVHVMVLHYHHTTMKAGTRSQTGPLVRTDGEGGSMISKMLRIGSNARDAVPTEELNAGDSGMHVQTHELTQFVTSVNVGQPFSQIRDKLDALVQGVEAPVSEPCAWSEEGQPTNWRIRYQLQPFELYGEMADLDAATPLDNLPSIRVTDDFVVEDRPFALLLTVYTPAFHVTDVFPQHITAGVQADGTAAYGTYYNPGQAPQIGHRAPLRPFSANNSQTSVPMFPYQN